MKSSTCSTPTSHSSSPSYSQPPSCSSSLCNVFHCCCKRVLLLWSFSSATSLIEVLPITYSGVRPGGTCNWPMSSCSVIVNGSVLKWQTCDFMAACCVLCRELFSVHFESVIVKCKMCVNHKMCLDFWRVEKKFCSLCVSLNNCAVHVILVS